MRPSWNIDQWHQVTVQATWPDQSPALTVMENLGAHNLAEYSTEDPSESYSEEKVSQGLGDQESQLIIGNNE